MQYLKTLASESQGLLGVMVSLQQPNTRLLKLFDRVSILGHGERLLSGEDPVGSLQSCIFRDEV